MKQIILGLCLFLVTFFIFTGCKNSKPTAQVTSIEIVPNKFLENQEVHTYSEAEAENIKTIMQFINNGLKSEPLANQVSEGDLVINVTLNNETQKTYLIDFDMTLPEAYMTVDNKTYLINTEATKAFVTATTFSPYFNIEFNKPQIQLKIDTSAIDFYYQNAFEYNYFNQSKLTYTDTYNSESMDSEQLLPVAINATSAIQIAFDQQPDQITQKIYKEDTLISSNEVLGGVLITPSGDGTYKIELTCTWKGAVDRNFSGSSTCFFFVVLDKPISFSLNHKSAYPGDTFAIFISDANKEEAFTVDAPFYEKAINFYPYEEGYVGFIPIYAWLTPGNYQIEATVTGSNFIETFEVEVLPKAFDIQYLVVDETTGAIMTNDNAAKDQVYFDKSKANPIQEKLWEGAFIQPAEGVISTDYCSTRYTNDNPTPTRHLAIDIANDEGTPIKASNNGKVALAMKLITTGNTVVIDHGMGLFTSSFHMSEILVKEGDYVTQGDIIGKMGTTGYSTGPHLHFGVWKDGTFLNPWTLFAKDPIGLN